MSDIVLKETNNEMHLTVREVFKECLSGQKKVALTSIPYEVIKKKKKKKKRSCHWTTDNQ